MSRAVRLSLAARSSLLASAAAGLVALATSAQAAIVVPTAAAASSSYGGYEAGYAIDQGGNAANTDWASQGQGAASFIDLALGGHYRLSGATIVDRATSGGGNGAFVGGVYDYTTQISLQAISGIGGTALGAAQTFSFSVPSGPVSLADFTHSLTLDPLYASYVRYSVLATNGANPGLSGISFEGELQAAVQLPPNLLFNGDFEAGNTGFGSSYAYVDTTGPWTLGMPATYAVGLRANDYHSAWAGFGDHTSGRGKMMILNGSLDPDVTLWSQSVDVQANRPYDFGAWIASTYPVSPAALKLYINDVEVGGFGADASGAWTSASLRWFSGASMTAHLRLVGSNLEWTGNDFALDDLSLRGAVPEPGTWALMIGGFGLVGVCLRRRRLAAA